MTQTEQSDFMNGGQFVRSLTVLTDDDGVPSSVFEREPQEYTVEQLKRWLKCRGLKLRGKRDELVERVKDCIIVGITIPFIRTIE